MTPTTLSRAIAMLALIGANAAQAYYISYSGVITEVERNDNRFSYVTTQPGESFWGSFSVIPNAVVYRGYDGEKYYYPRIWAQLYVGDQAWRFAAYSPESQYVYLEPILGGYASHWLGVWGEGFQGVDNASEFYYGEGVNYFYAGDSDWLAPRTPEGQIPYIYVEGTITNFTFTTPESGSTLGLLLIGLGLCCGGWAALEARTR